MSLIGGGRFRSSPTVFTTIDGSAFMSLIPRVAVICGLYTMALCVSVLCATSRDALSYNGKHSGCDLCVRLRWLRIARRVYLDMAPSGKYSMSRLLESLSQHCALP